MVLGGLHLEDLPDGASRSIPAPTGSGRPEGFVVRKKGQLFAYVNSCPHTGAPLDWNPDQFLDAQGVYIICAMHGALFEIDTGLCIQGPCINQRLERLPIRVVGERIERIDL